MMLLCTGCSFRNTPVALRERLAFDGAKLARGSGRDVPRATPSRSHVGSRADHEVQAVEHRVALGPGEREIGTGDGRGHGGSRGGRTGDGRGQTRGGSSH